MHFKERSVKHTVKHLIKPLENTSVGHCAKSKENPLRCSELTIEIKFFYHRYATNQIIVCDCAVAYIVVDVQQEWWVSPCLDIVCLEIR